MKRLPLSDGQAREWYAGTLSVVRRRMVPQPTEHVEQIHGIWCEWWYVDRGDGYVDQDARPLRVPFTTGEIVFIGESWMGTPDCLSYKISDPRQVIEFGYDSWRSPITMPAWASRSKARIVSVRPEQEAGVWTWVIEIGRV